MLFLDPEFEHLRARATRHSEGYWCVMVEGKQELLHRVVMDLPAGCTVDHKNNNKDDCRKENLRVATYSQNNCNVGKKLFMRTPTSKYKGVYKYKDRFYPWWAYIKFEGKRKSLGYFKTEIEAAEAYNKAAKELHGDFAKLNEF